MIMIDFYIIYLRALILFIGGYNVFCQSVRSFASVFEWYKQLFYFLL